MVMAVIFKKFAVHQLLKFNLRSEDQIQSFKWQQIVNSVSAKYTLKNARLPVKRATSSTCYGCKNHPVVLCYQITAHQPSYHLSPDYCILHCTALHWPFHGSLQKQTRNHPPLKSVSDHSPSNNLIMKTTVTVSQIISLPSYLYMNLIITMIV